MRELDQFSRFHAHLQGDQLSDGWGFAAPVMRDGAATEAARDDDGVCRVRQFDVGQSASGPVSQGWFTCGLPSLSHTDTLGRIRQNLGGLTPCVPKSSDLGYEVCLISCE